MWNNYKQTVKLYLLTQKVVNNILLAKSLLYLIINYVNLSKKKNLSGNNFIKYYIITHLCALNKE